MDNNTSSCTSSVFLPFSRHGEDLVTDSCEKNSCLRIINNIFDSNRSKRRKRDVDSCDATHKAVPWKKRERYSPGVVGLHEEVNDFYDAMSPTVEEKEIRLRVVEHVQGTVHSLWSQAKVEVFGSFKTVLYLPTSDIDMVVTGKWESLPLNTLRTALIKSGINDSDISVLSNAAVPLVRLVHSGTKVKVDISFNVLNGIKSAEMIKDFIKFYPALPKLVLVLKQFLVHRGLNEVYYGGMSSYSLTLLIISFLQGHHRPKSIPITNFGTLLIEFFELYGINFNYEKVSICVQNRGSYRPKQNPWGSYLSIEDPFCQGNDIAKGTYLMREIKNAFENAYNTLHKAVTDTPDCLRPSILQLILDVDTNVFIQRQWFHEHFEEILDSFIQDSSRCKDGGRKENMSRTLVFNSSEIKGTDDGVHERACVKTFIRSSTGKCVPTPNPNISESDDVTVLACFNVNRKASRNPNLLQQKARMSNSIAIPNRNTPPFSAEGQNGQPKKKHGKRIFKNSGKRFDR